MESGWIGNRLNTEKEKISGVVEGMYRKRLDKISRFYGVGCDMYADGIYHLIHNPVWDG